MKTKRKNNLRAAYHKLRHIAVPDILEMHTLFQEYYHNVSLEVFMKDMNKKEGAILLREKDTGKIKGFTTIVRLPMSYRRKVAVGIFSGDTVLDKEYWGSPALHSGYLKFLLKTKLTRPLTPLFWLLICKGYKTYLLMANNLRNYYPRYDRQKQSELESLVSGYCKSLFPKYYKKEPSILLDFGSDYQRLKENVAPITDTMRRNYPKIAYFEKMNPTWQRGTELPCIGEIDFRTIFAHGLKTGRKIFKNSIFYSRHRRQTAAQNKVLKYKYQR